MRILILSDLHANLEALGAISESWDELWILGDLVNYGPDPVEVVDFARRHAARIVRGNHDHALGYGVEPACSAAFREMAAAMQSYTETLLDEERKAFLRNLPLAAEGAADGKSFYLCHATPSDPLYRYLAAGAEQWRREAAAVEAEVLLTGHTHIPFIAEYEGKTVVNPGSAGQPKHGEPRASYAVWQDGRIALKSVPYDFAETARKILSLPLERSIARRLVRVLETGAPG